VKYTTMVVLAEIGEGICRMGLNNLQMICYHFGESRSRREREEARDGCLADAELDKLSTKIEDSRECGIKVVTKGS
jgi:hypothetical protein